MHHSISHAGMPNEDYALANQEQGIHLVCDGHGPNGGGGRASEFVGKRLEEKLVQANRFLRENEVSLQGTKRLLKMQEIVLNAFSEVQADFLALGDEDSRFRASRVSGIAVWLSDRFAILAHIGNCRAYLYRKGRVYTLTRDHPVSEGGSGRSFGIGYAAPDLFKIEFEPEDLLFLATDGLYGSLQNSGMIKLVQSMVQGQDLKAMAGHCSHASGDHATLVMIQFPDEATDSTKLTASERVDLIGNTPLCRYMDFVQKSHIAALCQAEEFEPGTILVQEGTEGECLYLIANGTLEIQINGQFIAYKKPGEFVGEVSLVRHGKRTATAIAKDRVTLLTLQRSDLTESFQKDLELERNFYKGMLEMVLDRLVEQGREIAKMKSL